MLVKAELAELPLRYDIDLLFYSLFVCTLDGAKRCEKSGLDFARSGVVHLAQWL